MKKLIEQIQNKEGEITKLLKEMIMLSHTSKLSNKLYVDSEGDCWISTEASNNSWSVDKNGNEFCVLASHYYSCGCNCDWCNDEDDVTQFEGDIIAESWDSYAEQAIDALEEADKENYFDKLN